MRGVLFWLHDGRVQEQTGCPLRGGGGGGGVRVVSSDTTILI